MEKPIYVIGHRNPDTDSICSAIGYAHLKQAMGENAIPARAGKINGETKYVLDYFSVTAPILINDLYPRVRDVMMETTVTLRPDNTLRDLGQLMKQHSVKSLPVIDEAKALVGIVTVGDLAKRYYDELEMQDLRETGVDFSGILGVLDGKLIAGENLSRKITGKVRIAGARIHTLEKVFQPGDIVLVGDRHKAQLASINCKIACLVLTGKAVPEEAVIEAARSQGTIIIQAPYDTYTCARLINQSIPVRMVMQSQVVTFKPSELISDCKAIIVKTNHRNYPVVENGRLIGLINRDQLIVPEKEKIILVDHNERTQAVEGIEEARIMEIIDHHRLGGLQTGEPIFIRHEPVGCTATIVANMHWHRNIKIPKPIAGLLLSAIISDTVLFKSPTCTPEDKDVAKKLAAIAGLDVEHYGMAVLKAGSNITNMSAAEIVHTDLKEFQTGEYSLAISQISVMDAHELLTKQADIEDYLAAMRAKEKYDMALLMITDIMKEATYVLYTGQPVKLLEAAFGDNGKDGVLYLPGVMSRKKQVVPPLVEAARDL
ncbi:manganese-dependent inorganic pyrophosphatase [Anaerospora hongkongensis]|uniref:inorganic diphosphatase n=1 Tax=Anaerospora hongkongensis TaxID=244830 RepID=A0A4R1PYH8_9FIRM|nr:putative manganese-dependent inorganic diphosphatase [Anaerospora hongkongensis]TCL37157.1 manganese-dependent inorganic pyrophosphatase [Anaerospora hongkongensis]